MSLTDELIAQERARPGRSCLTCQFFRSLEAPMVDEINEAYRDDRLTRATVWRFVRDKFDPDLSDSAFHNHYRRGHDQR